jgi:hypothetical protein
MQSTSIAADPDAAFTEIHPAKILGVSMRALCRLKRPVGGRPRIEQRLHHRWMASGECPTTAHVYWLVRRAPVGPLSGFAFCRQFGSSAAGEEDATHGH